MVAKPQKTGMTTDELWRLYDSGMSTVQIGAMLGCTAWNVVGRLRRAGDTVLDPFVGSGTTCRVAERLCRDSIGIDLGYKDLQEKRTDDVQKMMVELL